MKEKNLKTIIDLGKSYVEAKEREKDRLRDNIHRRRQVLESQEKNLKNVSNSPFKPPKGSTKQKIIKGG